MNRKGFAPLACPAQINYIPTATQAECEEKSGQPCVFKSCDYIPLGKTLEETCGKNFKKGWVPETTQ